MATALILLFRRIGQPAIVACIVGGLLLQTVATSMPPFHMDTLHDLQLLGIVLLLVLAGMQVEVDRALQNWRMFLVAFGQVSLGALLGGLFGLLASSQGWITTDGHSGLAVFALCLALSSTAIVVENLQAKGATSTPYGQAILILMLFQDIVAVLALSLIGLPGEGGLEKTKTAPLDLGLQFFVFAGVAILLGRTVMIRIIERVRYDAGLLLIFVLGWAGGLAGLAIQTGFSPTVAGFLAGVALSFTPHRASIELRIEPLKVFGITIYFIFMGTTLPLGELDSGLILPIAMATFLIVAVRPLTSLWLAQLGGMSSRESSHFGLAIGQGSEFAMILSAGAYHAKILDESGFLVIVMASVISMVISSWVQLFFRKRGGTSTGEVTSVDEVASVT